MKKLIIISIVSIFILALTGFSYQQYNSVQHDKKVAEQQAKIKKDQELFDKAITEFHNNSEQIYNNSSPILVKYSSNWKLGLGSGSMATFVNLAKDGYSSEIDDINALFDSTTETLKTISKASQEQPERYNEVYNECKKLYATTSALIEQVNNPSGSYITFNQNVNNLLQEFESGNNIIEMLMTDSKKDSL